MCQNSRRHCILKKKTGVNLSPLKLELDGKGISKNKELSPSGLSRFFVTLKNSFNKILGVNMLMVLGNLPLLFLVAVLAGYTRVTAYLPSGDLFQNFNGIFMIELLCIVIFTIYRKNKKRSRKDVKWQRKLQRSAYTLSAVR